ncbi:O-antigen ligase family protein [Vibrio sp. Isolate33]|uniref:O-antigen ligase family protein n=1 Tax=Vibrio sp. Isolate33 TaxID=2908539 RepID=UPI001EFCD551|nr:O-antigen ligase family protein [Vibrio sp. Isolate33]MCG9544429.1 O-antigen ligase family protein [Vibrio sp. Isolate33]
MIKKQALNIFFFLPFVWIFSGLFIFENGDKVLSVIIIITIATSFFIYRTTMIRTNLSNNWWLYLIVLYLFFIGVSYVYKGDFSGREARAAIGAFFIMLFLPYDRLKVLHLQALVILGSVCIMGVSVYYQVYLGKSRMSLPVNPIPYATLGASFAITAFILAIYEQSKSQALLLFCGFSLATSSVLLSESRGVWLALAFAVMVVSIKNIKRIKFSKTIVLMVVVVFSIIALFSKGFVYDRYQRTISEFSAIEQGNLSTSIGVRLQLWNTAISIADGSPILGVKDYKSELKKLYDKGELTKNVITAPHPHNEILNKLVQQGGGGVLIYLSFMLFPVFFFKDLSLLGKDLLISIPIIYIVSGLTDIPMYHGQTLIVYLVVIGLLYRCRCFK